MKSILRYRRRLRLVEYDMVIRIVLKHVSISIVPGSR